MPNSALACGSWATRKVSSGGKTHQAVTEIFGTRKSLGAGFQQYDVFG
ncbi:hypothetical protein ABT215_12450 [Streptomyces sp900105755]